MSTVTKEKKIVTKIALPKTAGVWERDEVAVGAAERARILHSVKGMWKNRKPDPIRELKKMRAEWDKVSR